jgi:outer membrane protein OmpA-like peptidoglycan-associated protein
MKVTAKCHNYSGCVLAYRGEIIELEPGAALVCPECGKPVVLSKGGGSWMKTTLILSGIIILFGAAGAFFLLPKNVAKVDPNKPGVTTTPSPKATPQETKPLLRTGEPSRSAEPPPTIVAPARIELDVNAAENKSVKAEVLTRIDAMPTISQSNKDKLYLSVDRARKMGKVLTIPFSSGQRSISPADEQLLKTSLDSAEVMKLRDDPTAVFVILGYADSKGDDKKNLAVSQSRAEEVLKVMKNKCGVTNLMHAVAMGSSKLLDDKNLEKNRIVEVWAVLP